MVLTNYNFRENELKIYKKINFLVESIIKKN